MDDTPAPEPDPGDATPSLSAQEKLIINERVKITAALLNNIATAAIGTGVIVPFAAIAYGHSTPRSPIYVAITGGWLAGGALLHLFTRWTLRKLEA